MANIFTDYKPDRKLKEQELIELLRKSIAAAESTVETWEDMSYPISNDLRRTIKKANELLQKLDKDKAFQDELPEWNIKKQEEPSLEELLAGPLRHIENVKKCFEACKSKSDIAKVIKAIPGYFGTWWAEYDDYSFTIVNRFFDDDIGEYYEEEYWYDYPEDWEDTDD